MCVYSNIMDYGRQAAPWINPPVIPSPGLPVPPLNDLNWIYRFLDLIAEAKKFDTSTGQPECEDPEKAKFMEEIRSRLDRIEKELGIRGAP